RLDDLDLFRLRLPVVDRNADVLRCLLARRKLSLVLDDLGVLDGDVLELLRIVALLNLTLHSGDELLDLVVECDLDGVEVFLLRRDSASVENFLDGTQTDSVVLGLKESTQLVDSRDD